MDKKLRRDTLVLLGSIYKCWCLSIKCKLARKVLSFWDIFCCKYGPVFRSNMSERHCFSCWFTTRHFNERCSVEIGTCIFWDLLFEGGSVIISYWTVHFNPTGLLVRTASLPIMIILIPAALVHSTHGFWLWCYEGGMIASIHISFVCWCGIYIK